MDDELLDVVDQYDLVIGTVNRKDYNSFYESRRGYIRAVDMFMLNDQGLLWIPIRTANKTIAPSGYDFSVGGHVGAGEDYETSLLRETEEEINLQVTEDDLEYIGKVKSTRTRYMRSLYLLRSNETPQFNPQDFVSAKWMKPEELLADIAAGHPAKGSLAGSVLLLKLYLDEKL